MAGILCFLPEFPRGSPAHLWWLVVTAIADDCDIFCLLIWQAIFYFSVVLSSVGINGVSMQLSITSDTTLSNSKRYLELGLT